MMQCKVIVVILVAGFLQPVLGHSWIACTDYMEKNAHYYDHDKCRGYVRSAKKYAARGNTFGQDTGFDYHPSESVPCKTTRNDATEYDSNHPIAVYYAGQQVVLAHPMKNHGSDACTNPYIPDNGNFIYRGENHQTSAETLSQFKQNLVADLGVKDMSKPYDVYPKSGYQNAPAFCENTDKSLGTYSFNVPSDIEPGRYTFIWLWGFNSAQDLYSGCFEVDIVRTLEDRNAKLLSLGYTDFYEPCGGETSKAGVEGNSNPGCSGGSGGTTSTGVTTIKTQASTLTTTTSTIAPPTAGPGQTSVPVFTLQISGYVELPNADSGTLRRIVDVHWECSVSVNYWSGYVIEQQNLQGGGIQHRLLQEGHDDISGQRIHFHASFNQPCDLSTYPPLGTLIRDEK